MNLTYKLVNTPIKRNVYVIGIKYEHGDCDLTINETYLYYGMSEEDCIDYIKLFNELSTMINNNRSYSTEFPIDVSNVKFKNYRIPTEYDKHYENVSKYFASMSIDFIHYHDSHGIKFEVTIKESEQHIEKDKV